jgi:hypothetical protein
MELLPLGVWAPLSTMLSNISAREISGIFYKGRLANSYSYWPVRLPWNQSAKKIAYINHYR